MTELAILTILASLPVCFGLTAASRAGARGAMGYAVFMVEEAAHRLLRVGQWLRDFHEWRESRKRLTA